MSSFNSSLSPEEELDKVPIVNPRVEISVDSNFSAVIEPDTILSADK